MEPSRKAPSMSQKIFDLELPMETVSLYLLCCGLADEGKAVCANTIEDIWNGSAQELKAGLIDLEKRNIIRKATPDDAGNDTYRPVSPEQWHLL